MVSDATVYVIDDDPVVRRSLARLVRSVGLNVETFPSAAAFLEQQPHDRAACLILDVRLPGLSGLDLQTALGPRQLTMPIIFITGRGNVPMSVRAMKQGAVDFLEKPFDETTLLACVHSALGRSADARAREAERAVVERRVSTLTPREREVLLLLVRGLLNKQVAFELGTAEKTIKIHRGRIMRKMMANSIADLVRMTQTAGLEAASSRSGSRAPGS